MATRKIMYKGKRTIHTFDYLRQAAENMALLAEAEERGSLYPSMMSLMASAFFLEASMNHLGRHLFTDWAARERKLNPGAKLSVIAAKLGVVPNLQRRPYQSFSKLFSVRDALAHGKTVTVNGSFRSTPDFVHPGKHLRTKWERECTAKEARMRLDDAMKIVQQLFAAAGRSSDIFTASTSDWHST